jgi:hypothetical protein
MSPGQPRQLRLGEDDGQARRDRSLRNATGSSGGDWDVNVVVNCIRTLAATGREFTADDVRPLLPSVGPQTIGAGFRRAVARGLIEPTGYRQSTTPSRHASVVRVWRGTPQARPATGSQRSPPPASRPCALLPISTRPIPRPPAVSQTVSVAPGAPRRLPLLG